MMTEDEFKQREAQRRKLWRIEHKENIIRSQARYWAKKLAELESGKVVK